VWSVDVVIYWCAACYNWWLCMQTYCMFGAKRSSQSQCHSVTGPNF